MRITSYIELTPTQEKTLEAFDRTIVRTSLIEPTVVATFTTFQAQDVKVTIDASGVIKAVVLEEASKGRRKINVVAVVYHGVVDEIAVIHDAEQAQTFFQARTEVPWDEFAKRIDTEDSETILADYAGSNIWEVEIL